jgi:hypothetical protein
MQGDFRLQKVVDQIERAINEPTSHRWRTHRTRRQWRALCLSDRGRTARAMFRKTPAPEYGVLLYWPTFADVNRLKGHRFGQRRERRLERLHKRACYMQRAVLIDIGEFLEMPQRALGALPCAKGLFRLDRSNGIGVDVKEKFGDAATVESTFRQKIGNCVRLVTAIETWGGRVRNFSESKVAHDRLLSSLACASERA